MARFIALLRKLLLTTPALIGAGVIAAYFLFAWFGFEPLVKWAAPKYIADKSRHSLAIGAARFDPLALSVSLKDIKLNEPDGKPLLSFAELFVDFDAGSLFKWAYTFDDIRLTSPHAQLELRSDGSLNWSALIEALKSKEEEEDKPLPRLLVRHIQLEKGRVDVADRKVGFATQLDPLNLALTDLSTLPDDKGSHTLAATTQTGAHIRWKGDFSLTPVAASGELAIDQLVLARYWPYLHSNLALAPPEGVAALAVNYRAGYADKKFSLTLDKLGFDLQGLALQGLKAKEPQIKLDKLSLSGGYFDLEKRLLNLGELSLNGGGIALQRDAAGRLDIQDWFPKKPEAEPATRQEAHPSQHRKESKASVAATPWKINLNRFALNGLGIHFNDAGFAQPLQAEIGNLQIALNAKAEAGGVQTQAFVENLGIDVSGIRLLSSAATAPLFVLGGISLQDGRIDLAARQASVGKISLSNGKLDAVRNAQGGIALLDAFKPAAGRPAPSQLAPTLAAPARANGDDTGWRYQVDKIDLAGFQIGLRDESVQPAGVLTLDKIEASVSGVSENLKTALPVRLGFQIAQGGSFQADARVVPATPSAEVKFKLGNLALAPAQPYLAQAANLLLASGKGSAQGRVKFDGKQNAAPRVDFQGGFEVADLLLNESEGGARFLAWKRLSSDSVHADMKALDMDELRLDKLDAKLIIFKDKTVNLTRILKGAPAPVAANDEEATTPVTTANDVAVAAVESPKAETKLDVQAKAPVDAKAFRVTVDRVRIENSEMEFADYSLALPFGTRIHSLKGAFNGISTQTGTLAELEIDGQVDEFGLARAVGQIDLFNPTGFMDIKTVFRNVEMVNLTPYSATFAGRKIASGRLSLDLEYKIKERQLLGENQIIMNKLTLGERVETPGAKNLPLDLAIAILQDSDGVIDLGLPVSGSLDDPQFSYGRIIWKAIGNILTKIVTAPFRALGALFGGGGEKLEKIAFEAGEHGLTPPEKEKFKQIAQILNKRPGLALSIHGVWAAEIDRPVMKESQLRRAVAEKMGIKLGPDEDAGPISTANPKSRTALESLYAQRFSEADWLALKTKWTQANPDKNPQSGTGKMMSRLKGLFKKEEPLSADDLAQLKDADLHGLLYQRLLEKETVTDEVLKALAQRRGESAIKGLAAAGAPVDRVTLGEAQPVEASGREVQAKLELGVAKK
jgi:hypothetical protein